MLFKILHGDASRISTDITPFHEGYCYVTYDGSMYVDMNLGTETAPNNKRVQLNAKDALTSIEAQALVNQNNGEQIKLWIGTQAELDAIDDRDDSCIYFTTDYFENMDSIVLNSNNKNSENKFKLSIDDDSNVVIENITLGTTSVLAAKPVVQTITLPSLGWDPETLKQTVYAYGVVADQTKQIITIASDTNCMAEYIDCGVQCIEQGINSLIFMTDTIPENDFVVYVTVQDCV